MTGRELTVRKTGTFNLREESAKAKLRDVWSRGHMCVELRDVPKRKTGKRIIFFCTLCLCRCFSDDVLDAHLQGNLHRRRREYAKSTLFQDVPWPFNDGLHFFFHHPEKVEQLSHPKLLSIVDAASDLEVASNCPNFAGNRNLEIVVSGNDYVLPLSSDGKSANHNQLINGVLVEGRISDLEIQHMGSGCISARFCQNDEVGNKMGRIWCAWLGEGNIDDQDDFSRIPSSDFAIVNFSYACGLGRRRTTYESNLLSLTGSYIDSEDAVSPRKKRKCFSDPEDTTGCLTEEGDSSCEDGPDSTGIAVETEVSKDDSQCHVPRFISSKSMRQELRRQKCLAAEKTCDICQHPMLPGKDAAVLLNAKTGNLACSSRNTNGAFHSFHISCLIHWILVCESELQCGKATKAKRPRGRKGKIALKQHISSILCPECQGTGININGGKLESPTISLDTIFRCKLMALRSHMAWTKDYETLEKSSTGLRFWHKEPLQEKALPMKLLQFYRAET